MEILGKALKYSELCDFDLKAPVTRYVVDGWVKVFLRVISELTAIVGAIAVFTSIEKRLDLTKNQKGKFLQDLRKATTISTYLETGS